MEDRVVPLGVITGDRVVLSGEKIMVETAEHLGETVRVKMAAHLVVILEVLSMK